jgi:hypothetical protein
LESDQILEVIVVVPINFSVRNIAIASRMKTLPDGIAVGHRKVQVWSESEDSSTVAIACVLASHQAWMISELEVFGVLGAVGCEGFV